MPNITEFFSESRNDVKKPAGAGLVTWLGVWATDLSQLYELAELFLNEGPQCGYHWVPGFFEFQG